MSKKLSPRNARTLKQLISLQTDSHHVVDGWISIHESGVTLCLQRSGEPALAEVTMSRRSFNTLIDWYNREQETR